MITLSREDGVAVFEALGYKTAGRWKPAGMKERVAELVEMVREGDVDETEDLGDKRLNMLFGAFVSESRGRGKIKVVKGRETSLGSGLGDREPVGDEELAEEELVGETEEEVAAAVEPQEESVEPAKPKRTRGKPRGSKIKLSEKKRGMSQLDAVVKVLQEEGRAMKLKEIVELSAERRYWISPNGKTPVASCSSRILVGMKQGRIRKTAPGTFAAVLGD